MDLKFDAVVKTFPSIAPEENAKQLLQRLLNM